MTEELLPDERHASRVGSGSRELPGRGEPDRDLLPGTDGTEVANGDAAAPRPVEPAFGELRPAGPWWKGGPGRQRPVWRTLW